jgi:hypothetical protein
MKPSRLHIEQWPIARAGAARRVLEHAPLAGRWEPAAPPDPQGYRAAPRLRRQADLTIADCAPDRGPAERGAPSGGGRVPSNAEERRFAQLGLGGNGLPWDVLGLRYGTCARL